MCKRSCKIYPSTDTLQAKRAASSSATSTCADAVTSQGSFQGQTYHEWFGRVKQLG